METEAGDWQTGKEEVRDRLGHLLQSGTWSDCSFAVGSEAEIVKAHKFVLSMASPVFETMFYGRWAEGNAPIPVSDIEPETFKELLNYIYTDKIKLATCISACELYCAAKKYMFPRVTRDCITYIEKNLKPPDVCYAYEMANVFDEANLKKMCLKKIKRKTKEILLAPSITEASLTTLKEIVSQDHLSIDTELDLFNAVYKWAKARGHRGLKRSRTSEGVECKRVKTENGSMPGSSTQDSSISQDNQEADNGTVCIKHQEIDHAELREVMSKIRFLTLSVKQLASGPARSGLLSMEDALALLMIAAGTKVDAPPGFTTRKSPRTPRVTVSTSEASEIDIVFSVYNFKTRKRPVATGKYHCKGFDWSVKIVPGIDTYDPARPMGIELECHGPSAAECQVTFTVKLEGGPGNQGKRETYQFKFDGKSTKHIVNDFMEWNEVCSTTATWLKSNTLNIQCRVCVSQGTPQPPPAAAPAPAPPPAPAPAAN